MRRTLTKTLSVLITVLMAMFCLTGCVRYRTTMNVKRSGRTDLSLVYAYHEELYDDDLKKEMKEIAKDLGDEGWTCEKYKDDEYKGYTFSIKNVKLTDLPDVLAVDALDDLGFKEFTIEKKGMTYTIEWDTNATLEASGLSAGDLDDYDGFMEVVIQLPVEAKDNNATDVSRDGKTYTWDLMEEDTIEIEFTLINYALIIGIPAAVLLVLGSGAAVLIIILTKKKKRKAALAEAPVPEAPAVTFDGPSVADAFAAPIPPAVPAPVAPVAPVAPTPAAPVAPAAPAAPAAPYTPAAPADPNA